MNTQNKIQTFKDLITWQKAHELVLLTYRLSSIFPQDERFGLTAQIRRCSVSLTSNIAEGFGRRTANDKKHFYDMAMGSLFELQNQSLLARDLQFIPIDQFSMLWDMTVQTSQLLNGLIRSTVSK